MDTIQDAEDEDAEHVFFNTEGDRLLRRHIEITTRYLGFAEAMFGIPPTQLSNGVYMEGYSKALEKVNGRL